MLAAHIITCNFFFSFNNHDDDDDDDGSVKQHSCDSCLGTKICSTKPIHSRMGKSCLTTLYRDEHFFRHVFCFSFSFGAGVKQRKCNPATATTTNNSNHFCLAYLSVATKADRHTWCRHRGEKMNWDIFSLRKYLRLGNHLCEKKKETKSIAMK